MDKKIIDPLLINEFVQNSKPIDISDIKVVLDDFSDFKDKYLLKGIATLSDVKKGFCFDTKLSSEWPIEAAEQLKIAFGIQEKTNG